MRSATLGRKLSAPNVRLAAASVGLCCVLLVVLATLQGRRAADVEAQRASSFFSDATGTRAMYLVLKRLLPAVEQWRQPPALLPAPAASAEAPTTLIVFDPVQALSAAQAQALDDWIAQGGQVILVTHRDWRIRYPEQQPETTSAPQLEDSYLQRHGFTIVLSDDSGTVMSGAVPLALGAHTVQWQGEAAHYTALVRRGPQVLVGSKRLGQGRIVLVPDAAAFSNQRLRDSQNASWLVTLCATWGDGRVFIDEFHQGFGSKRGLFALFGLFLFTPWGWMCLQWLLAGALYVFGPLQGFGRPHTSRLVQRQEEPLAMVEARGGLFAAARAKRLAAECMHHYLISRLSKSVGSPVNLDDAVTRQRVAVQAGHVATDLEQYVSLAQRLLRGTSVSDQDFLRLGQLAARIRKEFMGP